MSVDLRQLSLLRTLLDIHDMEQDDKLSAYLELAESAVLQRLYPYADDDGEYTVPVRYSSTVVEIAQYLYNKAGAEGETSHSENGIARSYESGSIPESMLKRIVPFVGVI